MKRVWDTMAQYGSTTASCELGVTLEKCRGSTAKCRGSTAKCWGTTAKCRGTTAKCGPVV